MSSYSFATALPIPTILYAVKKEVTVQLQWQTNGGPGVLHCTVEKSANGRKFEPIGTVDISPNSLRYQYTDMQPFAGSNYYRLKMLDKDGGTSYTDIRAVQFGEGLVLVTYPSPVKNRLTIVYPSAGNGQLQLRVFSNMGKTVLRQQVAASGNIGLELGFLPAGIYWLQVNAANGSRLVKIIKE